MDKREEKTLRSVYESFSILLKEKGYGKISAKDLIEKANISRSTFYAHFKSIKDVLSSFCDSIFSHVFSLSCKKETGHDFSSSRVLSPTRYITHIFYHFYEDRDLISSILNSEGSYVFIDELKVKLSSFMDDLIDEGYVNYENVPSKLVSIVLTESFASILSHWVKMGCIATPEQMCGYFVSLYFSTIR
ncbi:MAG TPA: hypothetical protein DEF61_06015 [Firmicutes bacterium]|nr:hypothetical protein [Bacillota bacterium]HBX25772.1 hypothetical protein [Bacillota bacterium]